MKASSGHAFRCNQEQDSLAKMDPVTPMRHHTITVTTTDSRSSGGGGNQLMLR